MSLQEQMKLFIDGYGLVSPYNLDKPGEQLNSSGNGVLYLSEYVILLHKLGLSDLYSDYEALKTMISCMPVAKGLLHRSPTHPDQEGPDDYIGLLVAYYVIGTKVNAEEVINYGKKHWGFFNNENPGSFRHKDGRFNWSAFLIRQPQLIALAYWAAGKKPFAPFVWWTALVIALAGHKKPTSDTDSRILAWMMAQVAGKESWLCRKAFVIFTKRLFKDYPNGMTDVFGLAFGNRNPAHPFATEFPKI